MIRAGGPASSSAHWAEPLCGRTWRAQHRGRRAGWACCGIARVTAVGSIFPTPLPRQLEGNSGLLATQPRAARWNHPFLGACSSLAASWPCDLGWPWAAGSLAWSCRESCCGSCAAPSPVAGAWAGLCAGELIHRLLFGNGSRGWHLSAYYMPG